VSCCLRAAVVHVSAICNSLAGTARLCVGTGITMKYLREGAASSCCCCQERLRFLSSNCDCASQAAPKQGHVTLSFFVHARQHQAPPEALYAVKVAIRRCVQYADNTTRCACATLQACCLFRCIPSLPSATSRGGSTQHFIDFIHTMNFNFIQW